MIAATWALRLSCGFFEMVPRAMKIEDGKPVTTRERMVAHLLCTEGGQLGLGGMARDAYIREISRNVCRRSRSVVYWLLPS